MKKIFVVEFGGTPSRAELFASGELCTAGLYPDMELIIYPLDKDTWGLVLNGINSEGFMQYLPGFEPSILK